MKIKGAIFDLDGTLLDTMSFWDTVGEHFLSKFGKQAKPGFREKFYVLSGRETAEMFVSEYGIDATPEDVMTAMNREVEDFYFHSAQPKPHAVELLNALFGAGVGMSVATATERYLVEAALARCGMDKFFRGIVTCTDVSASKTRPDIYLAAMSLAGTTTGETAVFEDAVRAARTAKEAGFYTVGVYDVTGAANEQEMRSFCDEYLRDLADLSVSY